MRNGHSVDQLFNLLDPRSKQSVSLRDFAFNLSHVCVDISETAASILAIAIDGKKQKKMIKVTDIQHFFRKHADLLSCDTSYLEDHPVFPSWLSVRNDFKDYFPATAIVS